MAILVFIIGGLHFRRGV